MPGLILHTAPAYEPVTLGEAKAHLRVDIADDDVYIQSLISASRLSIESELKRQLVTATWDLSLDTFPYSGLIEIPLPPLQSIGQITYLDQDGDSQTLSASSYNVDAVSQPGTVVLAQGSIWPLTELYKPNAVTIRFVAGYGNTDAVPQPIKQAMLFMVSDLYENRESIVIGAIVNTVSACVQRLLAKYKLPRAY